MDDELGKICNTKHCVAGDKQYNLVLGIGRLRPAQGNWAAPATRAAAPSARGLQFTRARTWPPESLVRVCEEHPPLATIERFARLVAVLNWYTRSTGKKLPELPGWIKPIWKATPSEAKTISDAYWDAMKRLLGRWRRDLF